MMVVEKTFSNRGSAIPRRSTILSHTLTQYFLFVYNGTLNLFRELHMERRDTQTIISVSNISKTYHLGEVRVPALRGVSLEVKRGDFLMITGRNGSGKSTLLRQLGLLDTPDAGEIILEGVPTMHLSEHQRRELRLRHLGYIFQEYALIPELTALENVSIPATMLGSMRACRLRAMELLHKVGLEHRAHHLPKQLSGGEQQKVAIARSLINAPKIIFADEPTANLDSIAARSVCEIFQKLNVDDGFTIMMITHEEEEQRVASRIITLADGRIV
jgi:putative ABC transport system ATP-binding protein